MEVLWIVGAVIMIWSTFSGWRQGVVRRLVELLGLIAIFLFASGLAARLRPWLGDRLDVDERVVFFGSWVLVLVGGLLGVRLLGVALQKIVQISIVGWLDRGGGAVVGAVFGAILTSCFFVAVLVLPVGDDLHDELREDPAASLVLHLAPNLYDTVRGLWDGGEFFENLGEKVEPAARKAADKVEAVIKDIDTPGS